VTQQGVGEGFLIEVRPLGVVHTAIHGFLFRHNLALAALGWL
jgi:hypothetical protein